VNILVDEVDLHILKSHNWKVHRYVMCSVSIGGKPVTRYLHREIMQPKAGECIDHVNGDPLDNRRSNLRICTNGQNQYNKPKQGGVYTSKYKGVSFVKETKRWRADIYANGKRLSLGRYATEEEAALAYNEGARQHAGEFAQLNEVA